MDAPRNSDNSPLLSAVILAGGLATRLRPLTEKIPKAMVNVHGRPFVDHQLALLHSRGIRHVILCVGYRGEMVRDHVGDGTRFGLRVDVVFDGERLLGTGGAIKRALPLAGEAFFVLYGDSYLPCNYRATQEAFIRSGKPALMTVFHNQGQWDASNVDFAGGGIVRYQKGAQDPRMRHIDYGLGVFRAAAFRDVPENEPYDLAEVYRQLLARDELAGVEVHERFYEVGSFDGIAQLQCHLDSLAIQGEGSMKFVEQYLQEASQALDQLDRTAILKVVQLLAETKQRGGRLFILGVGGGAAHASHAVNDFRKLVGLEAYAPTDNVSELTARTNDEGWATVFVEWLKTSRINENDAVFVISVGGGNEQKNVSPNLVSALQHARQVGAKICGVVGRDGGYTATVADACVIVPTVNASNVTPHTESFQALVWHLMVSHPLLKTKIAKWESVGPTALPVFKKAG